MKHVQNIMDFEYILKVESARCDRGQDVRYETKGSGRWRERQREILM